MNEVVTLRYENIIKIKEKLIGYSLTTVQMRISVEFGYRYSWCDKFWPILIKIYIIIPHSKKLIASVSYVDLGCHQ